MEGRTVTIRLLDPPLHEFLPSLENLLVEVTELRLQRGSDDPEFKIRDAILHRVLQLHEQNPMLGLRVCRLGIVYPEIYAMQVRAIFEAACDLKARGIDARPDVMIPGVGTQTEMQATRDAAAAVAAAVLAERGMALGVPNRHDDRAATGVHRCRQSGRVRAVLFVRNERPHADDLRV